MSRQSHQSSARPLRSWRDGRSQGTAGPYSALNSNQAAAYATSQAPLQTSQYGYATGQQYHQPTYETGRVWEQTNPEAYQVANDPRLEYNYQGSASTDAQTQGQSHVQGQGYYADSHAYPYQQAYTQYSSPNQSNNTGLTATQLYTYQYGQETSNMTDAWKSEGQREGPWYGNVEPRQS